MIEISLMIMFIIAIWWLDRHHREQGFLFYRHPIFARKGVFGSAPNPENIIQGYNWLDFREIKSSFPKKENYVFLDTFRFFDHFLEKSKISNSTKKRIEKTEVWLDPRNLTQGVTILGATGSGKSEMYYSLLNQNWYNRALIHDIKQDFEKFYYRKKWDIIYNAGLDERSHIWDFLNEEPPVQEAFFTNLLSSMLGEKKDYFSQAAQKKFSDTTKAIYSIYHDESTEKKWTLFITAIKDLIHSMQTGESKSDSDVSKTMDQVLEIFELSAFFVIKKKRKTFLIEDFFKRKNGAKLYLSNVEAYNSALRPIFTGFIAAFTMVHASRDSYAAKNGDYTFYLLDEYLGFINFMDEDTVDRIHLRLRSYGCCPVSGLQKLPKKEELRDTLLAANYLVMVFGTAETKIVEEMAKKIGKTEYWYEDRNESHSEGKKTNSYSKQQKSMTLISNDMIHGLGEKYEHIAYFPLKKTIYKGYTAQATVKQKTNGLIKSDTKEFYQMKFKDFQVRNVENFDEVFEKNNDMTKLNRYKMYKKYEAAKAKGEVDKFVEDEKIVDTNFDSMFSDFVKNEKIIDNKMNILSLAERMTLAQEWSNIDDEDIDAQVEFIEKNQLWGACPEIFEFTEAEKASLESDF